MPRLRYPTESVIQKTAHSLANRTFPKIYNKTLASLRRASTRSRPKGDALLKLEERAEEIAGRAHLKTILKVRGRLAAQTAIALSNRSPATIKKLESPQTRNVVLRAFGEYATELAELVPSFVVGGASKIPLWPTEHETAAPAEKLLKKLGILFGREDAIHLLVNYQLNFPQVLGFPLKGARSLRAEAQASRNR